MAAHSFVFLVYHIAARATFCCAILLSSRRNILVAWGRVGGFRMYDPMDAPLVIDDCPHSFYLLLVGYFYAAEIRTCI